MSLADDAVKGVSIDTAPRLTPPVIERREVFDAEYSDLVRSHIYQPRWSPTKGTKDDPFDLVISTYYARAFLETKGVAVQEWVDQNYTVAVNVIIVEPL